MEGLKPPPYARTGGSSVASAAREFLAEERGSHDIGATIEVYTSARNDIRKTINPYALSAEANTPGLSLREHAARAAHSFARAEKALEFPTFVTYNRQKRELRESRLVA